MTVIAIAMVRDEEDVIETTVGNMLAQVDHVIVADNLSTDATSFILRTMEMASDGRLTVLCDQEPAYLQSAKMSRLAAHAAALGATWTLPFDADECWMSPFGRIGDVLMGLPPTTAIATAALYDHVATAADPTEGDIIDRMPWRRREPAVLPKVACRPTLPVTIEQGNHGATYAQDSVDGLLVVRHYPYRSAVQMARKVRNGAAAYAATDLPESAGAHWRRYGALQDAGGDEAIADVFETWFYSPSPEDDPSLVYDPAPVR